MIELENGDHAVMVEEETYYGAEQHKGFIISKDAVVEFDFNNIRVPDDGDMVELYDAYAYGGVNSADGAFPLKRAIENYNQNYQHQFREIENTHHVLVGLNIADLVLSSIISILTLGSKKLNTPIFSRKKYLRPGFYDYGYYFYHPVLKVSQKDWANLLKEKNDKDLRVKNIKEFFITYEFMKDELD